MGKRGAGFSEVKAEVVTESSEGVPDGSRSRWWGVSKRETWRTSHAHCGAGSGPESNHAGPQALFAARTHFPGLKEPGPSSLGKPPALTFLYQFSQLHFALHSGLCFL